MSTYAPPVRASHRPHINPWFVVAVLAAALIGVGAFEAVDRTSSGGASPGQAVADKVDYVWATADPAAINAIYAANVHFLLISPGERAEFTTRAQLADTIHSAVKIAGYTYKQIGPVSSYWNAGDGDTYVTSLIQIKGAGHPTGIPAVGFYRVHNGKVIRQIFMDAEHY